MRLMHFKHLALATVFILGNSAWAWSHHDLVTSAALSQVAELDGKTVRVSSFQKLLKDLGITSALEFNKSLQIHKAYQFSSFLGETEGQLINLKEVLSIYSDEPDWGMDKELFSPDQYPELWKNEYAYMGGTKGTPSQAFRHMYWREFYILKPLQSFKIPKVFAPMGEAPERARIFIELSRRARNAGHPYWAARFIANALHYLEDVANPFHAAQTPTKKYLLMPFTNPKLGAGFTDFVVQLTNIVSYYHFAFEDYVGVLMELGHTENNPEGQFLSRALATPSYSRDGLSPYDSMRPQMLIKEISEVTSGNSARAGQASMAFFPQISVPYREMIPQKLMDKAWWENVLQRGKENSQSKQEYFNVVTESFSTLGDALRDLVSTELQSNSSERQP